MYRTLKREDTRCQDVLLVLAFKKTTFCGDSLTRKTYARDISGIGLSIHVNVVKLPKE